jgi:hypothetical protein
MVALHYPQPPQKQLHKYKMYVHFTLPWIRIISKHYCFTPPPVLAIERFFWGNLVALHKLANVPDFLKHIPVQIFIALLWILLSHIVHFRSVQGHCVFHHISIMCMLVVDDGVTLRCGKLKESNQSAFFGCSAE